MRLDNVELPNPRTQVKTYRRVVSKKFIPGKGVGYKEDLGSPGLDLAISGWESDVSDVDDKIAALIKLLGSGWTHRLDLMGSPLKVQFDDQNQDLYNPYVKIRVSTDFEHIYIYRNTGTPSSPTWEQHGDIDLANSDWSSTPNPTTKKIQTSKDKSTWKDINDQNVNDVARTWQFAQIGYMRVYWTDGTNEWIWTITLEAGKPYAQIEESLPAGVTVKYKMTAQGGDIVMTPTRLAIPADYTNNILRFWNQKGSKDTGTPWMAGAPWTAMYAVAYTLINSGSSAYLFYGNDYAGGPMSWLNGNDGKANWSLDKVNKKFSFEFFLNHDLKDVADVQINACDALTDWSGSTNATLSIDTVDYKEGTGSLQIVATVANLGTEYARYNPTSAIDISDKEFLKIYSKSDDITNVTIRLKVVDGAGNWRNWIITPSTINTWERDPWVIPIRKYNDQSATAPDIADIDYIDIEIYQDSGAQKTITIHVDDISKDTGQWVKVEVYVPDTLRNDPNFGFCQIYGWTGSAWSKFMDSRDPNAWYGAANEYFLDGTRGDEIFSSWNYHLGIYPQNSRGQTQNAKGGSAAPDVIYSSYYGLKKRIGFALKMPPSDGQDTSTYGISQIKLKVEIYYDDDGKTTYEFEDGTNQYYGLQNYDLTKAAGGVIVFNPGSSDKFLSILFYDKSAAQNNRIRALEVQADHDERVLEVWFKSPKFTLIPRLDDTTTLDGNSCLDFMTDAGAEELWWLCKHALISYALSSVAYQGSYKYQFTLTPTDLSTDFSSIALKQFAFNRYVEFIDWTTTIAYTYIDGEFILASVSSAVTKTLLDESSWINVLVTSYYVKPRTATPNFYEYSLNLTDVE